MSLTLNDLEGLVSLELIDRSLFRVVLNYFYTLTCFTEKYLFPSTGY